MKIKIISGLLFVSSMILLIMGKNILPFCAGYFLYTAILDFYRNEVEYFDVANLMIITSVILYRNSVIIGIVYSIIVLVWGIIEFVIHREREELVMKIGIVDFFYVILFFTLFLKSVWTTENIEMFAAAHVMGIVISLMFVFVYRKIKQSKMIPYLFVMYPMMLSCIVLLTRK